MNVKRLRRILVCGLFLLALNVTTAAQARVEKNVVYGMFSGTALLLDVYYPARPNGFGIVLILGSAWSAPLGYSATSLKDLPRVESRVSPLTEAGYTVFVINHRATPTFRYPAAVEDAHRAVRFVRHNAAKYGINPDRIGGWGGSSGGHLISLLGTLDGAGDPNDPDPVNRESSKLQCVVTLVAPVDLSQIDTATGAAAVSLFLGVAEIRNQQMQKDSTEYKIVWDASPIKYVSPDDPPFLLVHGDADATVPFHQSEMMEAALKKVGVPVKLIRIEGGDHGFRGAKNPPNYMAETVKWFDKHLRKVDASQ